MGLETSGEWWKSDEPLSGQKDVTDLRASSADVCWWSCMGTAGTVVGQGSPVLWTIQKIAY